MIKEYLNLEPFREVAERADDVDGMYPHVIAYIKKYKPASLKPLMIVYEGACACKGKSPWSQDSLMLFFTPSYYFVKNLDGTKNDVDFSALKNSYSKLIPEFDSNPITVDQAGFLIENYKNFYYYGNAYPMAVYMAIINNNSGMNLAKSLSVSDALIDKRYYGDWRAGYKVLSTDSMKWFNHPHFSDLKMTMGAAERIGTASDSIRISDDEWRKCVNRIVGERNPSASKKNDCFHLYPRVMRTVLDTMILNPENYPEIDPIVISRFVFIVNEALNLILKDSKSSKYDFDLQLKCEHNTMEEFLMKLNRHEIPVRILVEDLLFESEIGQ